MGHKEIFKVLKQILDISQHFKRESLRINDQILSLFERFTYTKFARN